MALAAAVEASVSSLRVFGGGRETEAVWAMGGDVVGGTLWGARRCGGCW